MRHRMLVLPLLLSAFAAEARPASLADVAAARLFGTLPGSWAGTGTVQTPGGIDGLRCRADYRPASEARVRLDLRCASVAFGFTIVGDLARDGERVSGTWTETTLGISGTLSGLIRGGRLEAAVAAWGQSADLSLSTRGGLQTVVLTSQSSIASRAAVAFRRD